jgi:hypothetical protein
MRRSPTWGPGEAATLNEFLNTPIGVKWLQELFSRKPKIDQTNVEKAALSGVFAAGYEYAWAQIAATRVGALAPDSASVPGIDPTKD